MDEEAARALTTKIVTEKRDVLLAEREILDQRRTELLAMQRKNERELADCRAAERFLGAE